MAQNKKFVSEIDRFLAEFDAAHPQLSDSQKAEIAKANWVAERRDHIVHDQKEPTIWDDF